MPDLRADIGRELELTTLDPDPGQWTLSEELDGVVGIKPEQTGGPTRYQDWQVSEGQVIVLAE